MPQHSLDDVVVVRACDGGDHLHARAASEGLLAHLAGDPGMSAGGTVSDLVGAIRRFTGEEPQSDDIAIIAVQRVE